MPDWLVRMWFSRVVLPLPRKPVMMVTGNPSLGAFITGASIAEVIAGGVKKVSSESLRGVLVRAKSL